MNRTNVKGTDNQIANVKNAGQEIHHESNSKAGCKDKHQTIKYNLSRYETNRIYITGILLLFAFYQEEPSSPVLTSWSAET